MQQAAFFHRCSADHVSVRRQSENRRDLVLDACGLAVGYLDIAPVLMGSASVSVASPIWIEVPAAD